MTTHYFICVNRQGQEDPRYFHYFTVEADSFKIPESAGWWATHQKNILAHTTSPECYEVLKKTFTNAHMREWLETKSWPVLKGWYR